MITLYRTVTFPQGHNITELIPNELDLYVTRMNHQLLDIHGIIAEGIGGLTLGSIEGILKILGREAFTHASSSAAGACLYHHRKANLLRFLHGKCRIKNRFLCSRHHRHPCRHHHLSGSGFVSHFVDDIRIRSDKNNVVFRALPRKLTVLGQKTVTRMYRLALHIYSSRDDCVNVQVGIPGRPLTDTYPHIRKTHMKRIFIFL